eukprot:Pompholyxophrys_punicea_v1_NODE_280_length_2395_cov_11.619231.p2 type:complete len:157 gc:universal NODE_280_length_2395_cov_11.619231:564-94(-)
MKEAEHFAIRINQKTNVSFGIRTRERNGSIIVSKKMNIFLGTGQLNLFHGFRVKHFRAFRSKKRETNILSQTFHFFLVSPIPLSFNKDRTCEKANSFVSREKWPTHEILCTHVCSHSSKLGKVGVYTKRDFSEKRIFVISIFEGLQSGCPSRSCFS